MLLSIVGGIETFIRRVGLFAALVILPCLMFSRLFEIITRHLNTPGSLYNAMESEFFLLFAFLIVGAAAVSDAHVRVDIFYQRIGERGKAWVDIVGTFLFVLPFASIVAWYGFGMVESAWNAGERSAITLGAPTRWIIISAMPVGISLLALAVLCRTVKQISKLLGHGTDAK